MEKIKKYFPLIEKELQKALLKKEGKFKEMYQMMAYHLGWIDEKGKVCDDKKAKGKRIRPALLLYLYELLGGEAEKAIPAALSIEIFHNFSLIHDDIEDHDEYRRGRLALWKKFGFEQAINTGDAMLILAQLVLLDLQEKGFPPATILEIFKLFNETYLKITEGQFLDMKFEQMLEVSLKDYLLMIERKTGALFGATFAVPAILGRKDKIEDFWQLGILFGLLYQIWDDYQGVWGREENTGKRGFSDIQKKKKTFPIIYSFASLPPEEKRKLLEIYNQESKINEAEIKLIISLLEKTEAQKATFKEVLFYKQKIISYLQKPVFEKIRVPLLELFEEIWQKLGI